MFIHHPLRVLVLLTGGVVGVAAAGCNHFDHQTKTATALTKDASPQDATAATRDASIDTASTAARRMLDDVYMAIDDLRANDTKSATAALDRAKAMLPIIRLGMQTATAKNVPAKPGIGLQADLVPLEESVAVSDRIETVGATSGKSNASSPAVKVSSQEVKRLVLPVDETATRLSEAQDAIDSGDVNHARALLDTIPDSIRSYVYEEVDEGPAPATHAASLRSQMTGHVPSLWKLTYGPWDKAVKEVEQLASGRS